MPTGKRMNGHSFFYPSLSMLSSKKSAGVRRLQNNAGKAGWVERTTAVDTGGSNGLVCKNLAFGGLGRIAGIHLKWMR